MKRGFFILGFLLFALFSSMVVYAQNDSNNLGGVVGAGVKNISGSLNDRTEDLLEREVVIPSWLTVPMGLLLGAGGSIKIQYLIILISIWIMLFIVILSALDFVPLFGGKVSKFLASIAIMLLLSISGALKEISMFFFDFWNMFGALKDWSFWKLVLAVFLSVMVIIGAVWLKKMIKKDTIITTAEIKGKEAGAGIEMLRQNYQQAKDEARG